MFEIVSFLGTEGFDPTRILDYEDGLTTAQILSFNVEVGRLCLVKEKKMVNGVVVALTSIFDKKVLPEWNKAIDKALSETSVCKKVFVPRAQKSEEERSTEAQKSVQELNKLNLLLSSARM